MRRKRIVTAVTAALTLTGAGAVSVAAATPAAPPGARSGLPIDVGVFAHNPDRVARFEQAIGSKVDVWQVAPQREEGFGELLSETKRTTKQPPAGAIMDLAIPLVSKAEAKQLGQAVAARPGAHYVRAGWEFNLKGAWPWTTDRIGAPAYVSQFKETAAGIREGCPSCRIEWNPNSGQGGVAAAQAAYPGDEWVDVVGVDLYSWKGEDALNGVGGLNEWAKFARAHDKKMSLPEWGVHQGSDGTGDDAAFVTSVTGWIGQNLDVVVMASYFDEPDAYIRNSVADGQVPKSAAALKTGLAGLKAAAPNPSPTSTATPSPTSTATPKPTATASPAPVATGPAWLAREYWQLPDWLAWAQWWDSMPARPTSTPTSGPTSTATSTGTASPTSTSSPTTSPTATPSPTSTTPPKLPADRRQSAFTDQAGTKSTYHLFTSKVQGPVKGLVVFFDGDGQYGHDNPDSSYALAGTTGVVAEAGKRGYPTLSIRTPDAASNTWWREGTRNAAYAAALIASVKGEVGAPRVVAEGFSGGSQLLTKFLIPSYGVLDAAVMTGGGGAPSSASSAKRPVMHWYTGAADRSADYDAIADAKRGSEWYRARGYQVTTEWPAGVTHNLSGRFGTILAGQLS